jgi:hypothetical protein
VLHAPPISFFTILSHFVSRGSISIMWLFRNVIFLRRENDSTSPTPKLEDNPSSDVRDWLLNIFAATPHVTGRSSYRKLRTRHAVVTGTHISWRMLITSG